MPTKCMGIAVSHSQLRSCSESEMQLSLLVKFLFLLTVQTSQGGHTSHIFFIPGLTSHFNSKLFVQLLQKFSFTWNYLACIVVSPHSPGILRIENWQIKVVASHRVTDLYKYSHCCCDKPGQSFNPGNVCFLFSKKHSRINSKRISELWVFPY